MMMKEQQRRSGPASLSASSSSRSLGSTAARAQFFQGGRSPPRGRDRSTPSRPPRHSLHMKFDVNVLRHLGRDAFRPLPAIEIGHKTVRSGGHSAAAARRRGGRAAGRARGPPRRV
jgi:hypothetical protein